MLAVESNRIFDQVTLEHNDKLLKLALKKMAKKHVVETCQQEHVMNEKDILKELQSSFIIRHFKMLICIIPII